MKRGAAASTTLALALGLVMGVGCGGAYDNGYAVDLVVSGDGTTDAALKRARTLEFIVTGVEMASSLYSLEDPFDDGEERVIYRPLVQGGQVTFAITARDADLVILGAATQVVTLQPGKTVTQTVKLGSGGGTGLLVDRASYDFGTFVSGQNATPRAFTVTNDSAAPTGPLASVLQGADAAGYSIEGDTCAGKVLAPGGACTVSVRLQTGMVGKPAATLQVSGDPPGMVTVALAGEVVPPGAISIAPAAGDFGSVAQGQSSTALAFEVRNTGAVATGALAVTIGGGDAASFAGQVGCEAMVLPPGGACTVMVTFSPGASAPLGAARGSLKVEGVPGGLGAAELRANVIRLGAIGISPGFIDFGKVNNGQTSMTKSFTITNTGTEPTGALTSVQSGNPAQFEIAGDTCQGQALGAGATCTIDVRFRPTQSGTATLVLAITGTPGGTVPATAVGTGGDFVTLTVEKTGASGAVSAPGVSCGADCTELYERDATVVLTALPDLTARFGTWTGGTCTGSKLGVCTVVMDGDKTLSAAFVARAAANLAFVSSTTIIPKDLGAGGADPLAAADTVCRTRAVQGGLSGTWKALLATSATSAVARLGTASGWLRTDGNPFVVSQANLVAGKILYPLRLDEAGTAVADDPAGTTGTATVATGADKAGASAAGNCTDWTAAGMYAFGVATGATETWISLRADRDCALPAHLYCLETSFATGATFTPPTGMRRVFLSQAILPPVTGVNAADNLCNAERDTFNVVNGAGVLRGGTYRALLAPIGGPSTTGITLTTAWQRVDGVPVAATAAGLFSDSLISALNVTANGTYLGNVAAEFPFAIVGSAGGVTGNGAAVENCNNWSSAAAGLSYFGGNVTFTDRRWSVGDSAPCAQVAANSGRLVCLEQ